VHGSDRHDLEGQSEVSQIGDAAVHESAAAALLTAAGGRVLGGRGGLEQKGEQQEEGRSRSLKPSKDRLFAWILPFPRDGAPRIIASGWARDAPFGVRAGYLTGRSHVYANSDRL
jgi:hypothetical protein